jgi:sporulation protein YhbH
LRVARFGGKDRLHDTFRFSRKTMVQRIQRDESRFRQIVRGKIRENLRQYVTHGEMIGRKGRNLVSIPIPQLEVPHFRYGDNGSGGVAQGDGEVGTPIGSGEDQGDTGQAGNQPGAHILEVEVSLEELADILGDELELPRIEPKDDDKIQEQRPRYTGLRRTGPESLRHGRRTYKEALKRQISSSAYNAEKPRVVPIREDTRYRSWKSDDQPHANAAVVYMMDVSGSMSDEQKEVVRTEAFWIDTWLKRNYKGLEIRYVIHDAAAKEVDEETFYHTRESGGTRISSAYRVCADLISRDFPPGQWNIYCFQFSDGDNWGEDNESCFEILRGELLPVSNLFCYGQVESPYGSGEYLRSLAGEFESLGDKLLLSDIRDRDGIFDSIKHFLGKGK